MSSNKYDFWTKQSFEYLIPKHIYDINFNKNLNEPVLILQKWHNSKILFLSNYFNEELIFLYPETKIIIFENDIFCGSIFNQKVDNLPKYFLGFPQNIINITFGHYFKSR
jgi:hypothetical protein